MCGRCYGCFVAGSGLFAGKSRESVSLLPAGFTRAFRVALFRRRKFSRRATASRSFRAFDCGFIPPFPSPEA
jgi:hypothetical protein